MALNKMRLISKMLECWLKLIKLRQLRRIEAEGAEVVKMRMFPRRLNFNKLIFFLSQGLISLISQARTEYFLIKKISLY